MMLARALALLAAASLALAPLASAQQKKGRTKAKGRPAAAAAAPAAPKRYALPDPVLAVAPEARKTSALAKLTAEKATFDYAASQQQFLKRYDGAADQHAAYAIDLSMPVAESPAMRAYVEAVAQRLLAPPCWTGPRPPLRFLLRGSPVPMARAYGSGVIELSTGLLERLKFTDGLAFVIAHELGHVLAAHHSSRERSAETISTIANLTASAAVVAREGQFNQQALRAGDIDRTIVIRGDLRQSDVLLIGLAADVVSSDFMAPAMSAGQEHEADRIALDLVVCARFSPQRAGEAMALLVEAETLPSARMEKFGQVAKEYAARELITDTSRNSQTQLKNVGIAVALEALVGLVTGVWNRVLKRRGSAENRSRQLAEYVTETYGEMPFVTVPADPRFDAAKADAGWRSLVAVTTSVQPVFEQVVSPMLGTGTIAAAPTPQALAPLASAFRPDPRLPATYLLAGTLARAGGDSRLALQHWQAGASQPYASRAQLVRLGVMQYSLGDGPGLRRTLATARGRLGDVPELLPLGVGQAVLARNLAGAETLTAQCITRGGAALYTQCAAMLGYDAACAPRTEEGKAALGGAVAATKFTGLFELPRGIERSQRGRADPAQPRNCVELASTALGGAR
jgi:Zn-dependent protease with chaperone function